MKRIILHWTAGTNRVSPLDRQHYHYIIGGDGEVIEGDWPVSANERPTAGKYAAHTLNCNTGAIGVALAGMHGAVESPFNAGEHPITAEQVSALWALCARLCKEFDIAVTRETVLTHAEVQPTLKIKQRGKWDITWLPTMAAPGDPISVGDILRKGIRDAMGMPAASFVEPPVIYDRPTLRAGSRGAFVEDLQIQLRDLGYFAGKIDRQFGPLTAAAVLAFQNEAGLETDGVVGAATWRALDEAQPRPERAVTAADLRNAGSTTLANASKLDVTAGLGAVAGVVEIASNTTAQAAGILPTVTAMVRDNWPALIVLACLAGVVLFSDRIKAARVRDAQTGANTKR